MNRLIVTFIVQLTLLENPLSAGHQLIGRSTEHLKISERVQNRPFASLPGLRRMMRAGQTQPLLTDLSIAPYHDRYANRFKTIIQSYGGNAWSCMSVDFKPASTRPGI